LDGGGAARAWQQAWQSRGYLPLLVPGIRRCRGLFPDRRFGSDGVKRRLVEHAAGASQSTDRVEAPAKKGRRGTPSRKRRCPSPGGKSPSYWEAALHVVEGQADRLARASACEALPRPRRHPATGASLCPARASGHGGGMVSLLKSLACWSAQPPLRAQGHQTQRY